MGFFSRKPLTRQQLAAVHAKKRIGLLKDQKKVIEKNRKDVENQLKENNRNKLSPQEQAVIVTADRTAKISSDNLSSLPTGDRDTQVSLVLERQREKLLKREGDLEFQKNKLELARKEK
jgi:hypothetical protein